MFYFLPIQAHEMNCFSILLCSNLQVLCYPYYVEWNKVDATNSFRCVHFECFITFFPHKLGRICGKQITTAELTEREKLVHMTEAGRLELIFKHYSCFYILKHMHMQTQVCIYITPLIFWQILSKSSFTNDFISWGGVKFSSGPSAQSTSNKKWIASYLEMRFWHNHPEEE